MGLLDRAQETLPAVEDEWIHFIRTLESLNRGVDFSLALFREMNHYFSIDKSALFFRTEEGDSDFICLSSRGYDKTTSNRLRLDKRVIDSDFFISLSDNRKPLQNNSQDVSFFKDYFSSREYGLMETLYWLPFFSENRIVCLIMISQWEAFPEDEWESRFSEISRLFSDIIYNSRKALINTEKTSGIKVSDSVLRDFIMNRSNPEVFLISVELTPLVEKLFNNGSGMSRVNLKNEIISVFRTMAGPNQSLLELENQKVLFMLDQTRISDKGLFIHQLSASLPLLFQDLSQPPQLDFNEYDIPKSEEDWQLISGKLLQ